MGNREYRYFCALGALAIGLASVPVQALAQNGQSDTAENARSDGTDTIMVTAQKREQRLQDVPMAISALTGEALKTIGATNFEDFARTVPGLDFSNLGAGQNRITIRGVSTFSGVSVVGIYLDESPVASPVNFAQPSLALYDLSRVEVLRGPQGTLYGENSLGGTLRYITNDPDTTRVSAAIDGVLSDTHGGGTNYDASAVVNLPIITDKLALRVVAGNRYESGYIDNVTLGTKDVNDVKTSMIRGKLLFTPTEELSIKLSALYQDINQGGPSVESLDMPAKSFKQKNEAPEYFKDRFKQFSGVIDYDFGGVTLQSATAYFRRDTDQASVTRGNRATNPNATSSISYTDNAYKSFSQEVRLASDDSGPLHWILGGYYKSFQLDSLTNTFRVNPQSTPVEVVPRDQDFRQIAAFGEVEYEFVPRLSATVGLRWFRETDKEHDVAANLYRVKADGVIPRFVLSYKTDVGTVYGSVSKGFRSPGVNRFPIPGVDVTFSPDTTWNYEIGTKLGLFDRQLSLNLAAYWIDWKNLQTFVARPDLGPSVFFVQNAATARVRGVEWDIAYNPNWAQGFSIGSAGNYTDPVFTSDTPYEGKKGNTLPKIPNWKYSFFAQYSMPVGDGLTGRIRADYEHTGQFPELGDNILKSGKYTLVNVRAGLDAQGWNAELFVDNLTNKAAALFQRLPTEYGVYRNRPRTIGIRLGYHY
ncbi:MAG: TonB-dependent receptor [Sphingobium sp.]|nr:TonB-dependent receptor [Sphingobium sp.]